MGLLAIRKTIWCLWRPGVKREEGAYYYTN